MKNFALKFKKLTTEWNQWLIRRLSLLSNIKWILIVIPVTNCCIPSKQNWGERESKIIVQNICNILCISTNISQWKNTSDCIKWFKNIENPENYILIRCNVKDFYPLSMKSILYLIIKFVRKITKGVKTLIS